MSPSAPEREVFMRRDPDRSAVARQGRARRAEKDRAIAAQVRRSRIDEALAARERAILTEYRSEAAS